MTSMRPNSIRTLSLSFVSPVTLTIISGLAEAAKLANTKVFHAGTAKAGEQIITNGGRVLGVMAMGKDLRAAQAAAYSAVENIHFDGAHFRRDIGMKAMKSKAFSEV